MTFLRALPGRGVALTAAVLVAGCGITRVVTPPEDTLATWSDHPLAPDPALATDASGVSVGTAEVVE